LRKRTPIVLLALAQSLQLLPPYLVLLAIDHAITPGRPERLWLIAAVGLLVHTLAATFAYYGRRAQVRDAEALYANTRERLFDQVQTLSLRYHHAQRTGELLSRVQYDAWALKDFHSHGIPTAIQFSVTVAGTAAILLYLSPQLVLLAFIPIPIAVFLLFLFRKRIRPMSHQGMQLHAQLHTAILEGIEGTESIRLHGEQARAAQRLQEAGAALQAHELRLARESLRMGPLFEVGIALLLLASLAVGGQMVIAGSLSIGTLVTFYFYVARSLGPLRGAAPLAISYQRAAAARERIEELLACQDVLAIPSEPLALPAEPQTLQFEHVHFSYHDGERSFEALHDVCLALRPGSRVAILGPSGSGKSTLGKLIPRLFDPDQGELRYGGLPLPQLALAEWRARLGYLGQEPFIFHGSLEENLRFGSRDASAEALQNAIRLAAVDEILGRKALGLATIVGEKGVRLSGGERKRIALARALLCEPELLIIDQLASDLQESLCQCIFEGLRERPGLAILYLGHRVPSGLEPEQVFWMENGRLEERSTVDDIRLSIHK
jgi:ABC-type multidrug transport system fused ATPase/permease subunit